jgi:NADPH:quinone reductase-like Zn-dependent oxidoreductase
MNAILLTGHGGFECLAYRSDVLLRYIERAEIGPVLARTYELRDIAEAQRDFLAKRHSGKIVLTP